MLGSWPLSCPRNSFARVSYVQTGGTLPGHTTLQDDHARLRPFGRTQGRPFGGLRASPSAGSGQEAAATRTKNVGLKGSGCTTTPARLRRRPLHKARGSARMPVDARTKSGMGPSVGLRAGPSVGLRAGPSTALRAGEPIPYKGEGGKTATCRRPPVTCLRSHSRHRPPVSFTARSQSCHRPFTHPSPSLVTINPSQGSNSYTMPILKMRPTVHFYQCDPLREIRS